jgi:hypothetical protein
MISLGATVSGLAQRDEVSVHSYHRLARLELLEVTYGLYYS